MIVLSPGSFQLIAAESWVTEVATSPEGRSGAADWAAAGIVANAANRATDKIAPSPVIHPTVRPLVFIPVIEAPRTNPTVYQSGTHQSVEQFA